MRNSRQHFPDYEQRAPVIGNLGLSGQRAFLTSPEGDRERWAYADLVEAAEQTVRRYEELELGLDLAAAGA